jgi:hypothetical protein
MMVTTKVTHGFVYNIVNYGFYQDPDNYEGNNETEAKVQRRYNKGANNNKNDKNDNNKEYIKDIGDKPPSPSKFIPPSLDEVKSYCQERNNKVDPEKFFYHYEANGWVQGKAGKPIKNWKAAVHTWEKNEFDNKDSAANTKQQGKPTNQTMSEQRKYDKDYFDKIYNAYDE